MQPVVGYINRGLAGQYVRSILPLHTPQTRDPYAYASTAMAGAWEVPILDPQEQWGGTCASFATAQLLRYHSANAHESWQNPSPYWIMHHALILDNMGEHNNVLGNRSIQSTWVHSTMAAVTYYGVPTVSDAEETCFNLRTRPSVSKIHEAYISKIANKRAPMSVDPRSYNRPFIFTAPCYESFMRDHDIVTVDVTGAQIGLHAWLCVGRNSNGYLLQSSWGKSWGGRHDGCAYATDRFMRMAFDAWSLRP